MSAFPFKTDDKSEEFCLSIAREMVGLFGISEGEAVRRVGKAFSHLPEITGDQHIFYHEDETFWAKELYMKLPPIGGLRVRKESHAAYLR